VRLSAKRLSKVVACAATLAASISAITGCPCWDETGIIVIPDSFAVVHSDHILRLVEHHRLPAIYPFRLFALKGGLLTYGLDIPAIYRQAAEYADRILRGANPSDLPVQAPNKFELIVNLKTATALGLEVPPTLLARADEVSRDFMTLLGGAAAWPITARAQQAATPVVGFLRDGSADTAARYVAAFRKGLNKTGYVEGQNVTVEYHWLEGRYDRLPALLAD
jgi:ABC transporter substrate binding protein